jgi:hypothetical protein
MSKPFTLRMAAHELIGEEATNKIVEKQGLEWLVYVLITHVEANDLNTETASLLRQWHDRRA